MVKRKIALLGGTFDPIHLGHTAVAAHASKQIGTTKVIFIPAKRSPLKGSPPKASNDDRLKMITLAIAKDEKFEVSDWELKRAEPSYTLETVRHFQQCLGKDTSIHWLMGADGVDELPLWYGIVKLIDECNLSVMYRAGCKPPDFDKFETLCGQQRIEKLRRNIIQTPLIDISSTEIRNKLAAGLDVSDMLHPSVAGYIRKHNLYGAQADS
jgi:nicotinate-nucleotide adenylyltransferase